MHRPAPLQTAGRMMSDHWRLARMSNVDDALDDELGPPRPTAADTWARWPEILQSGSYTGISHGQCSHLARAHTDDSRKWARQAIEKLLKDSDFRAAYENMLALAGPPQPHHWRV